MVMSIWNVVLFVNKIFGRLSPDFNRPLCFPMDLFPTKILSLEFSLIPSIILRPVFSFITNLFVFDRPVLRNESLEFKSISKFLSTVPYQVLTDL